MYGRRTFLSSLSHCTYVYKWTCTVFGDFQNLGKKWKGLDCDCHTHVCYINVYFYRPQTNFAKVMFLHLSVILFMGGVCLSACWDTHPQSRHPTGADTPWSRHPPEQTPPPRADTHHPPRSKHPPGADTSPPCSACWEIRATSGRYASYWNAFLSFIFVCNIRPYGQNTF